jgi:biotin carboxylase
MPSEKGILICGISKGMSNVILQAKLKGLNVSVITKFRHEPYLNLADMVIITDPTNPQKALKAAQQINKKKSFDGVITVGSESAISVATIAEKFNLPGPSIEIAKLCTNKELRLQKLYDKKIPVPYFRIVNTLNEVSKASKDIGFPVVIKPVENSAARGVKLITNKSELSEGVREAKAFSRNKKANLILEEYINGSEHSTESFIFNKKAYTTGFTDRNYLKQYRPYFVELGDSLPTKLNQSKKNNIINLAERASRVLGIKNWVSKGDMILTKDGPRVLEIACRTGGPKLGTEIVPLSNGTNIMEAQIQAALGEKINKTLLRQKFERGVEFQSIFSKTSCRLQSISGVREVYSMPGVYCFHWNLPIKKGSILLKPHNLTHMLGYIITTGKTNTIAKNRAIKALKKIKFKTKKL